MNIISIGDSWGKVVAGGGTAWPETLGIRNLNVSGSRAEEWANNKNNWLSNAQECKADIVIVSLMGNDYMAALQDGVISPLEIFSGLHSMKTVVTAMLPAKIIVLLYADPFNGKDDRSNIALPILNAAIRFSCIGLPVAIVDSSIFLTSIHFDGKDIHPNQLGHQTIADTMSGMLYSFAG
ncbi:MAG: SGNH/GDSL hydrolase family protein [Dehalococcoidia bacterium]|nr:MAG: SGNH/GDSL hydrolase family protein [Dehalococcoidia bacterium]